MNTSIQRGTLMLLLCSLALAYSANISTPIQPSKDGHARPGSSNGGSSELSVMGTRIAWMAFDTVGIDLQGIAKAILTLEVADVKAAGNLSVFALTSPILVAENNVTFNQIQYNPLAPAGNLALSNGMFGENIHFDITTLVQSGTFTGLVLATDNALDATLTSKDSDRPPVIYLTYATPKPEEMVPPGTIVAFGGSLPPAGWLLCDGAQISRSGYPALFAAIGAAHGAGDGSTTFHLPDLRGRFLRGVDGGRGLDPDRSWRTPAVAGGNGGDSVGSVQNNAMTAHQHTDWTMNFTGAFVAGWIGGLQLPASASTFSSHPLFHPNSKTDLSSETRPTNAYVHYIIKY